MSEDTTKNLPSSFEERVLSELAAIRQEVTQQNARLSSLETRLTSLEEKVDARLRETRPIWEGVQAQLKDIVKQLDTLDRKFDALIKDLFNLRVRVEKLEENQPTG